MEEAAEGGRPYKIKFKKQILRCTQDDKYKKLRVILGGGQCKAEAGWLRQPWTAEGGCPYKIKFEKQVLRCAQDDKYKALQFILR